jgi:putative ABC transport system permease protein
VLGSVVGITVARYALQFLSNQLAVLPIVLPHLQRVSLNGRVLLFNIGLCVLLAILCSLAPILLAFRTDIQATLRGGRSGAGPKGSSRMFSILIAIEAAFAFLLLVGSGLMIRSLVRLQQEDHGFRPDHVLTVRVPVGMRTPLRPGSKYDTRPRQIAYYSQILERVQQLPGTQAVAIVNNLPLSGINTSVAMPGTANSARTISPQYFAAMGIPLLAGRTFTDDDQARAPQVAILNEFMARQLFPDRNPVGQVMPSDEAGPPLTVVGVVKDTTQLSYELPVKGEIYFPMRQFVFGAFMSTIVVRTPGDPLALASAVQKAVWEVDPSQPVVKVETMEDIVSASIWRPRFSAWIFSILGGLAVLLTSAGVYGVVAYTTTLRAYEVGIRVALGATPRDVVAVIVRGAMAPLCAGLVVGVGAALLLSKLMASVLYEIQGTDPVTYLSAVVLLLVIGVAASTRPAWRAAVGDPVKALRAE